MYLKNDNRVLLLVKQPKKIKNKKVFINNFFIMQPFFFQNIYIYIFQIKMKSKCIPKTLPNITLSIFD